jgi:hypothetical protein
MVSENSVLNQAKAFLYPCVFKGKTGKFTARFDSQKVFSVLDVCRDAVGRGGVKLRPEEMAEVANVFLRECGYQLANGNSISTELFMVKPAIRGVFDTATTSFNREQHSVRFNFRPAAALKALASRMDVVIGGLKPVDGVIGSVFDSHSKKVNAVLTPGAALKVTGRKICVSGSHEDVGLYFVNQADGSRQRYEGDFLDNTSGTLSFVVPSLTDGVYRLEIQTQYSGNNTLKFPRRITSMHDLRVGADAVASADAVA